VDTAEILVRVGGKSYRASQPDFREIGEDDCVIAAGFVRRLAPVRTSGMEDVAAILFGEKDSVPPEPRAESVPLSDRVDALERRLGRLAVLLGEGTEVELDRYEGLPNLRYELDWLKNFVCHPETGIGSMMSRAIQSGVHEHTMKQLEGRLLRDAFRAR
jgi:hypothetical protein